MHAAHVGHMIEDLMGAYSFHRCGRSPSLEEGGLGGSPVKAFGLAVDCI